jgi:hypothetical protein
MLGESPRTIFLHYYGRGEAGKLAGGFRTALNELAKNTVRCKRLNAFILNDQV